MSATDEFGEWLVGLAGFDGERGESIDPVEAVLDWALAETARRNRLFVRLAEALDATSPSPRRSRIWRVLYQLDSERVVSITGPERLLCYDDRNATQAILHGRVTEAQRQEIDQIFVARLVERVRTSTEIGWLGEDAFAVQQGMFTHVLAPLVREAAAARRDAIGLAVLDRMDDALFRADDPNRPPRRVPGAS